MVKILGFKQSHIFNRLDYKNAIKFASTTKTHDLIALIYRTCKQLFLVPQAASLKRRRRLLKNDAASNDAKFCVILPRAYVSRLTTNVVDVVEGVVPNERRLFK